VGTQAPGRGKAPNWLLDLTGIYNWATTIKKLLGQLHPRIVPQKTAG
jgi:hypothetical protein